jgi:hypothetical protein
MVNVIICYLFMFHALCSVHLTEYNSGDQVKKTEVHTGV